jgi:hypothetical protein
VRDAPAPEYVAWKNFSFFHGMLLLLRVHDFRSSDIIRRTSPHQIL